MNRVHVVRVCSYVLHATVPARATPVTGQAAPRRFPVRGIPYSFAHNVSDLRPDDYSVDAAVGYRQSVVAEVGLHSSPEATVLDAWVVRAPARQADCHTGLHLPGAPRAHAIAAAAADARRIGLSADASTGTG